MALATAQSELKDLQEQLSRGLAKLAEINAKLKDLTISEADRIVLECAYDVTVALTETLPAAYNSKLEEVRQLSS